MVWTVRRYGDANFDPTLGNFTNQLGSRGNGIIVSHHLVIVCGDNIFPLQMIIDVVYIYSGGESQKKAG